MPVSERTLFDHVDERGPMCDGAITHQLRTFCWKGKHTTVGETRVTLDHGRDVSVETFVNEFWTSRQRAAHSLHEISYRACFKPQLPRFFIERLTKTGGIVYDPFMGRGTTLLEAALLGRAVRGCDVNPLSAILLAPRLSPPYLKEVASRLGEVDWRRGGDEYPDELLAFYHPETLREICALKTFLTQREKASLLDSVDQWIRMVAVNRLTGHSRGFFSVYTLPPNQAASVASQKKINAQLNQVPPRRDVPGLIVAKSRSLLLDCHDGIREILRKAAENCQLLTAAAAETPEIASASVDLVVTSPPFLDIVDYAGDNWLRCWFCGIDAETVPLTILRKVDEWRLAMARVFQELTRVLKPGGYLAFEVGELRGGHLRLEEHVIPSGLGAGLDAMLVLINDQKFTKTANCWGVANNARGTNTNRVVVFRRAVEGVE
jgi:SAM-dependent methyltransferase